MVPQSPVADHSEANACLAVFWCAVAASLRLAYSLCKSVQLILELQAPCLQLVVPDLLLPPLLRGQAQSRATYFTLG